MKEIIYIFLPILFIACNKKQAEQVTDNEENRTLDTVYVTADKGYDTIKISEERGLFDTLIVLQINSEDILDTIVRLRPDTTDFETEDNEPAVMLKLKKTPCFGTCPVYEVTVDNSYTGHWKGRQYVEFEGEYTAEINSAIVREVQRIADKIRFYHMAESYPEEGPDIPDLPLTIIGIRNKYGRYHEIRINHGAPRALLDLTGYVEKVIKEQEWKRAEDPPKE